MGVHAALVRLLSCRDGLVCSSARAATVLAGAGLALRDPAAIGACRPGDAFNPRLLAPDRYMICGVKVKIPVRVPCTVYLVSSLVELALET